MMDSGKLFTGDTRSSSFAELVDLNGYMTNYKAVQRKVKLFRGACGSKLLSSNLGAYHVYVKLFRGACGSKSTLV